MGEIKPEPQFTLGKNYLREKDTNIRLGLGILCLTVIAQGMMVTGGISVSINVIERAFTYNSIESGSIDTVYNVLFAFGAIFVGYYGDKKKTYWLSLGASLMALGCLTFILPQFISHDIRFADTFHKLLCDGSPNSASEECITPTRLYLAIFCIGYAFIGLGASPLHTLAVSYLDENTSHGNNGLYLGVFYLCSGLGPAVTFLLSQPFLDMPVNLVYPPGLSITPDSESWVGAWWIIYLIGALILTILSIPILLLPSYYTSKSEKIVKKPVRSVAGFKNFYNDFKKLIRNAPYIIMNIGVVLEGFSSGGLSVFLPKFVEAQFRLTSGTAALYSGILVVLGATVGLLCGGYIIKKFKWGLTNLITFTTVFSFCGAAILALFLISCPSVNLLGVEIGPDARLIGFSSNCSQLCDCNIQEYNPICLDGKVSYFSACSAGCQSYEGELGSRIYSDCLCVEHTASEEFISEGICSPKCDKLILFMILGFFGMFLTFFIFVPVLDFTLRVVDIGLQSFGLGLQQLKLRVAFIVAPIVFGHFIDKSCLMFQSVGACTHVNSNCLEYDLKKFSLHMFLLSFSFKTAASICHLIIFIILKLRDNQKLNMNASLITLPSVSE